MSSHVLPDITAPHLTELLIATHVFPPAIPVPLQPHFAPAVSTPRFYSTQTVGTLAQQPISNKRSTSSQSARPVTPTAPPAPRPPKTVSPVPAANFCTPPIIFQVPKFMFRQLPFRLLQSERRLLRLRLLLQHLFLRVHLLPHLSFRKIHAIKFLCLRLQCEILPHHSLRLTTMSPLRFQLCNLLHH